MMGSEIEFSRKKTLFSLAIKYTAQESIFLGIFEQCLYLWEEEKRTKRPPIFYDV